MMSPVSRPLAMVVVVLVATAPVTAGAELPEPFLLPATADDYRLAYSLEAGLWADGQATLQHRIALQIPLWGSAAGAVLPFGNALGGVNDSVVGNLRLYGQWFRRFEVAPRTAFAVGGGLDLYAPTATPLAPQDLKTALLTGQTGGEVALNAPGITFAFRPRLQLAGELWIFSLQTMVAAAVLFEGNEVSTALEWGAMLAVSLTRWLALGLEVTGFSWLGETPVWTGERIVTMGGGLRFTLPFGWRPGLWVRGPLTERQTELGMGTFVGFELQWQHDRRWFLF